MHHGVLQCENSLGKLKIASLTQSQHARAASRCAEFTRCVPALDWLWQSSTHNRSLLFTALEAGTSKIKAGLVCGERPLSGSQRLLTVTAHAWGKRQLSGSPLQEGH